ncbi:MAG: FRG domain-containing protein [Vampirovibrionia bacterium]
MSDFVNITINSLEELTKLNFKLAYWKFRGQADYDWPLSTTFERAYSTSKKARGIEEGKIEAFKSLAHLYIKEKTPSYDDDVQWLHILQHYGGATRLLDFTYSKYIALYFAIKELLNFDASITCINTTQIIKHNNKYIDFIAKNQTYQGENKKVISPMINDDIINKCIKEGCKENYLIHYDAKLKNKRLYAQQGTFLFPTNINKSFQEHFFSFLECKEEDFKEQTIEELNKNLNDIKVVKIKVPKEIHKKALQELFKMNITANILFPDIQGLTMWLNEVYTKVYE